MKLEEISKALKRINELGEKIARVADAISTINAEKNREPYMHYNGTSIDVDRGLALGLFHSEMAKLQSERAGLMMAIGAEVAP